MYLKRQRLRLTNRHVPGAPGEETFAAFKNTSRRSGSGRRGRRALHARKHDAEPAWVLLLHVQLADAIILRLASFQPLGDNP